MVIYTELLLPLTISGRPERGHRKGWKKGQAKEYSDRNYACISLGHCSSYSNSRSVNSYASLVNPDEGTLLNFIQAPVINGVKFAKIKASDQSTILCSVFGANPPIEVIKGYLRQIWKSLDIDKICLVRKGVSAKGVFFFDNKPLLVKPWNPEMDISTEAITSLPIWVRFMDLDIKYWGMASLSKLGSILGIPIKTDKYTMEKTRLKHARLLIKIPVDDAFLRYIEFVNDQEVVGRLQVNMNGNL
ncbi:hypothetical protein Cgig2_033896 [Carnegiea gigantea]|uniref:DUF4283 domain-containing protein n=1 Tax=Carnegiea gigantea TaxID=171969 RepID=A0A9Q1GFU8_9CARY|nr:hypothetical protein Cgig2_033896 [Carnegiea gigantea]